MSYLSFLHIQCSMGYDETEIINYVIFGERAQLEHFPGGKPEVILDDETGKVRIRPLYFFWDKADEKLLRLYEGCQKREEQYSGKLSAVMRLASAMILRYIQNKYREVFLSYPETLFLSEKAEAEIPQALWKRMPDRHENLHLLFGERSALEVLGGCEREMTLFLMIPPECRYERLLSWLLEAEQKAGVYLADLFVFGELQQKEGTEEMLDEFYEETGLAGSYYMISECKKMLAPVSRDSLFLDWRGLTLQEVGRPSFYVDGAGIRTGREIHKLKGVCDECRSLRNQLDRAFLSAL